MSLLVADVRGLAAGAYESIIVFGGAALDDGGGGVYYWNGAASNADDGAEWIKPTSVDSGSPGRWHRVEFHKPATTTTAGTVELATSGENAASVVVQGNDRRINLTIATDSTTAATAAVADLGDWLRFTNAAAKTYTIPDATFAANDVLTGINIGAGDLSLAPGAGVTLTGALTFATNKAYAVVFTTAATADVVGGA